MEIETYRYLMSALIQVFGALIAVDAIFLIIRYQTLNSKLKSILYDLSRNIVSLRVHRRIWNELDTPRRIYEVERASHKYMYLDNEAIDLAIKESTKKINKAIKIKQEKIADIRPNAPKMKTEKRKLEYLIEDKETFEDQVGRYHIIRDQLNKTPILVVKVMGVPSILVIGFSIFLCWSDSSGMFDHHNFIAILSIIFSGIGFGFLIFWARSSFIETR